MHQWLAILNPPCLGKVKAHDLEAVRLGDPRACGNDQVDALAKAAGFVAPTHTPEDDFANAVRVRGRDGKWIVDINAGNRVRRDANGLLLCIPLAWSLTGRHPIISSSCLRW